MSDTPDDLVLVLLREIRSTQLDHGRTLAEHDKRLADIDRHIAMLRRDQALDAQYAVGVRESVAALAERVED